MADDTTKPNLIKASDLPFYEDENKLMVIRDLERDDDVPKFAQPYVSGVRRGVTFTMGKICKHVIRPTRDAYRKSRDFIVGTSEYFNNSTVETFGKPVFITSAGLLGILAGRRGGLLRKSAYAGIGIGGATVLCYPYQSKEWSVFAYRVGWYHFRKAVKLKSVENEERPY